MKKSRFLAILLGMVLLMLPFYAYAQHAGLGLFAISEDDLDKIQDDVTSLRELTPLSEVERQSITRDELRARLVEDVDEDTAEINITGELFVFLDLMEEGQDLYTILVDVYSEQILGFYDYELNRLYIVSGMEGLSVTETGKVTFAHEYTHALQDQHFDLESLPEPEDNSDYSLAVTSLVEGDANLATAVYIWYVLDDSERESFFQEGGESGDGAFAAAPRVVQENVLFPYEAGFDFALALFQQGGWQAIDQAYSDPPQSTEQILHPEKYLQRDEPQVVTMPDLESALGAGWSQLDNDVIGELNIRIYLETFVDTSEATKAAEGWDGDRYLFLKDTEGRKLFVLHSVWDSAADAREFFDAYTTFVDKKSGGTWGLFLEEKGTMWWKTEGLSVYLSQRGSEVLLIVAPDESIAEAVRGEFPQIFTEIPPYELPSWAWPAIVAGGAIIVVIVAWRLLRRGRA